MNKIILSNYTLLKIITTSLIFSFIVIYFMTEMSGVPIFNSEGFIARSKKSLLDLAFYISGRPFTVDLFYKIFGSKPSNAVIGQQVFSAFCWTFLGFAISQTIKNKILSLISLLIISTIPFWWNIAGWTNVMRSESITFSLFALWYSTIILYHKYNFKIFFILLCVVTILFSFTRDNIPYFLLLFSILLIMLPRKKHAWFTYFIFVLVVFGLQITSAQMGKRHQFPLINVIFQRILIDDARTDYFISQGMPVDNEFIAKWEGKWASDYNGSIFKDPKYKKFVDFTLHKGKYVYGLFLLKNPDYTFKSVWDNRQRIFIIDLKWYTGNPPQKFIITTISKSWNLLTFATIPLFLIYPISLFYLKRYPYLFFISTSVLVNAVFIFHADAMEVTRHSLIVMIVWFTIFIHTILKMLDITVGSE